MVVSVSMAAWQAGVTGVVAVELAVGDALGVALVAAHALTNPAVADALGWVLVADLAPDATDDVGALPGVLLAAATLNVGVAVTVVVWVTVAVAVTVLVTVASGLAVVVGISGTHWERKTGSVVSTVWTPVCSAAMASVAALTAAAGSVAPVPPELPPEGLPVPPELPPEGLPVPPVLPPEGVPVPEGEALDACEELVLEIACRDVEAALVAAFFALLVVVDDDASVCWSVWYWAIAAVYVALSANTASCSGVALIEAKGSPAVTVSPGLTSTAVTTPLVGKLALAWLTWWTVPDRVSACVRAPAAAVTVR
jgi:hypothetical protein